MTSSSVKISVTSALHLLSVLALLFVNVSIRFSFPLVFTNLCESFTMIISVNTLHFIPIPMDIYVCVVLEPNLVAIDEKVNL